MICHKMKVSFMSTEFPSKHSFLVGYIAFMFNLVAFMYYFEMPNFHSSLRDCQLLFCVFCCDCHHHIRSCIGS